MIKLPYKEGWHARFGILVCSRGIIAIPKILFDYRREIGINSQHIDLWATISSKYRGIEKPKTTIKWLAELTNKKPNTITKLLNEMENKSLLKRTWLIKGKYEFDLSPTNDLLNSLLTRDTINN